MRSAATFGSTAGPTRWSAWMPAGFVFEDESVQLWTPLAFTEEQRADTSRHSNSWQMLARLRPGVSLAQARARLDQLAAAELERFPEFRQVLVDAGYRPVAVPLQEALVRDIRGTLYLLWAGCWRCCSSAW